MKPSSRGRPRNKWVNQICPDKNLPPADLWRRAVSRGHRGATLRPQLANWLSDDDDDDDEWRSPVSAGWLSWIVDDDSLSVEASPPKSIIDRI